MQARSSTQQGGDGSQGWEAAAPMGVDRAFKRHKDTPTATISDNREVIQKRPSMFDSGSGCLWTSSMPGRLQESTSLSTLEHILGGSSFR
mmetsp:Transcript_81842/g.226798  ORF Transcript_81842/g.226798 Transcript_81842/m.226798 type:complete len:90 (-) Transcript_81842:1397-1666(-)